MPEGPECRRIAEQLAQKVSGKTLVDIRVMSGRYTKKEITGLTELKSRLPIGVAGAGVHGKFIYIICEGEYSIWNTLGMSGSWKTMPSKHARVALEFSDGTIVYFTDMRNFGTIKISTSRHSLIEKLQSLGPDMLAEDVSHTKFIQVLRKKNKQNVCKVLMNQNVIAGVGNYLKADALWATSINPHANISDLSDDDLISLCDNIKKIIRTSYETGGATIQTFSGLEYEKGNYSSRFLVYNRKVDAEGNKVVRETTPDGRTTHWVREKQTRGAK